MDLAGLSAKNLDGLLHNKVQGYKKPAAQQNKPRIAVAQPEANDHEDDAGHYQYKYVVIGNHHPHPQAPMAPQTVQNSQPSFLMTA